MWIELIVLGIGIVLSIYNINHFLRIRKKEYLSVIVGKDNKIIQTKKVLDETTIDYKKNSYILDKDLFIKLGHKFYSFHYVDNVNPIDLRNIKESTVLPKTLNSILYNDFANKLNEATRKGVDIGDFFKNNIVLIGIAIIIMVFMFL